MRLLAAALLGVCLSAAAPEPFDSWLLSFREEALAAGLSAKTLQRCLGVVTPDPKVLALDQQHHAVFQQPFETFSAQRITPSRLARGRRLLKQHRSWLQRIEKQYDVPAPLLVAIWGLETDFGRYLGRFSTLRALATLAHGSSRQAFFRKELLEALRLVDRGDLQPQGMRGAWAGELGQTQFLPSSYAAFAVDGDGDGRRDLIRSAQDALASTAHYLKSHGWRAGEGWEEDTPNFEALRTWNRSRTYAKTIGLFARQLEASN
ncbi:MAG: lytic murein transglycosylase [Firmicutes bacterium]|nr:lytic murein transglycosylase [Bacillota bacterium]